MMRQLIGQVVDCENRYRRDWHDFTKLWKEVKESWRDQRRDQFEREHLARLPASLSRLSAAVGELREAMQRAEHELNDTQPVE